MIEANETVDAVPVADPIEGTQIPPEAPIVDEVPEPTAEEITEEATDKPEELEPVEIERDTMEVIVGRNGMVRIKKATAEQRAIYKHCFGIIKGNISARMLEDNMSLFEAHNLNVDVYTE